MFRVIVHRIKIHPLEIGCHPVLAINVNSVYNPRQRPKSASFFEVSWEFLVIWFMWNTLGLVVSKRTRLNCITSEIMHEVERRIYLWYFCCS